MQRHKIVGKASVGVLLFLPLVAVGIALALMLSLGNQGTPTAQADSAKGSIELSIATSGGPAGTTDCTTKVTSKCTYPVNSSFSLSLDVNDVTGVVDQAGATVLAGGYSLVQMMVIVDGTIVTGPEPGDDKGAAVNPVCLIPAVSLDPAGNADATFFSCNAPFGGTGFEVKFGTGGGNPTQLATANFNCAQVGTGVIALINDPNNPTGNSAVGDSAGQPHLDKTGDELLIINCTPPDGEININKVDKDSGALLSGSCWLVSASVTAGSPPSTINKPVDVVSDNNAEPICDNTPGAPFKVDLSDRNPDDGLIGINISGALQLEFGTNVWHFEEVKAPDKYAINDSTKYDCTFTNTPKDLDPGKVGCDEDGGGSITIANARVQGNINITFNDPFGGAQADICVDITLGVGNVCDGDDGSSDGSISLTLANGVYNVALDPASIPTTLVVPKDPTKVEADLVANQKVSIKFDFNTAKPTFEKKKSFANLFLTAQGVKLDPATCEASTDVAVFVMQLNNPPNSQNPKGDNQDVRAFEYEIRFDGSQVCVSFTPGKFVANNNMSCSKTISEEKGLIEVGCVTDKTTLGPIDNSNLELGVIEVRPQPSLYSIIKANQDNGVVVQIRNDQCNLADLQGHKINAAPIGVGSECPDSDLTIRWLEGDVNGDCEVNVTDQQLLAFRWGVSEGVQLYNDRYNLVGDLETINIKDVQFVFGRTNSKCDQFNNKGFEGPTNPLQLPANKKATP